MSCRPVQTVYISGMILDANNSGQYMRAELHGADPVTHMGINLNSDDRVDISSGQSLNLHSLGGGGIQDIAVGVGGSGVECELGYVNLQGSDGVHTAILQVNPDGSIDLTGLVNVIGTLEVNGVPVIVP